MRVLRRRFPDTHQKVQDARARFERGRRLCRRRGGKVIAFGFRALLRRFERDESYADIARAGGVKTQAVHQLYNRYFRDLFCDKRPKRTRYREDAYTQNRRLAKQIVRRLPRHPWMRRTVRLIRRRGWKATPLVKTLVQTPAGIDLDDQYLRVNGHLCRVFHSAYTCAYTGRDYFHFNVSTSCLTQATHLIFWCGTGTSATPFVVPTDAVLAVMRLKRIRSDCFSFWIPLQRKQYLTGRPATFNYWLYREERGWQQLAPV